MPIQRQFICKNQDGGYTLMNINEFDCVCYLKRVSDLKEGATRINRELFDIIANGLKGKGYMIVEGNYAEAIDDYYVWALWLCVNENKVDKGRLVHFLKVDEKHVDRIINWMERRSYIIPTEDCDGKILMSVDEFIAKYGKMEI